ncbi:MAG: CarD family transcriptional regulator [Firmicutes bacterium]|nr:CarD family transcriptional regulator [Bacillota bacterium]MBR0376035.1 CarD family transcriptional regulator [Bacillota bacterium]
MFSVGEKIVYPVHGAGVVESIENREILGEVRSYYVLRITSGDLQVLVPVDTAEKVGMRLVSDAERLRQARSVLSGPASPWEENWNRRYRLNMDKIKSGDICELAEVVRNLTLRDNAKGLSAGEKKMLDNARRILLSEIVLADGITAEEASARLNSLFDVASEQS